MGNFDFENFMKNRIYGFIICIYVYFVLLVISFGIYVGCSYIIFSKVKVNITVNYEELVFDNVIEQVSKLEDGIYIMNKEAAFFDKQYYIEGENIKVEYKPNMVEIILYGGLVESIKSIRKTQSNVSIVYSETHGEEVETKVYLKLYNRDVEYE